MPADRGEVERAAPLRGEVTRILSQFGADRAPSGLDAERLLELTYRELRELAARCLSGERGDHTLQPTALVHEAWLKLADQERVEWRGRAHFLGIAAQAMRRILVDHARAKQADRRGGHWKRVELDSGVGMHDGEHSLDLVALDAALERLRELAPEQARIVELRFFGGLEMTDVAQVVGMPLRSVEREWRFARVWLEHQLRAPQA